MKSRENFIFEWPQMPPMPPPNQALLIRVATSPVRKVAREELRIVLRQTLAAWSGILPEQLPLHETPRGPKWHGQIAGHPLDISLSYCDGEGWIGLFRNGAIGIDAMPVAPIAEAEDVARHYFSPAALAEIQQSKNPARAFAFAWTSLEARLKCLKLELTEWNGQKIAAANQVAQSAFADDNRVIAVATAVA